MSSDGGDLVIGGRVVLVTDGATLRCENVVGATIAVTGGLDVLSGLEVTWALRSNKRLAAS